MQTLQAKQHTTIKPGDACRACGRPSSTSARCCPCVRSDLTSGTCEWPSLCRCATACSGQASCTACQAAHANILSSCRRTSVHACIALRMHPWELKAPIGAESRAAPRTASADRPCLLQRVVPAAYAFVIHTQNPTNNSADEIFAEVVLGLGESIVSGLVPGAAMSFKCPKSALDSPEVGSQLPAYCLCNHLCCKGVLMAGSVMSCKQNVLV